VYTARPVDDFVGAEVRHQLHEYGDTVLGPILDPLFDTGSLMPMRGTNCASPAAAGCATGACGPLARVRPQNCGTKPSLDRLKEWFCWTPCKEQIVPAFQATPYHAPLRAYFPGCVEPPAGLACGTCSKAGKCATGCTPTAAPATPGVGTTVSSGEASSGGLHAGKAKPIGVNGPGTTCASGTCPVGPCASPYQYQATAMPTSGWSPWPKVGPAAQQTAAGGSTGTPSVTVAVPTVEVQQVDVQQTGAKVPVKPASWTRPFSKP
jgi:hypothetical protein